jgi:hypothetical protein
MTAVPRHTPLLGSYRDADRAVVTEAGLYDPNYA